MKKESLLNLIARKGYDVFYAANLNFATYDIVTKLPSIISFMTIAIGILGLVFDSFRVIGVSVSILILGILRLYVEKFSTNIDDYCQRGVSNTEMLNQLKDLYVKVKDSTQDSFGDEEQSFMSIEKSFNDTSNPKQILFANWFAHYKMFIEKDHSWMDEQIHFRFWRDKIPGSLKLLLFISLIICVILLVVNWCSIIDTITNWFSCSK